MLYLLPPRVSDSPLWSKDPAKCQEDLRRALDRWLSQVPSIIASMGILSEAGSGRLRLKLELQYHQGMVLLHQPSQAIWHPPPGALRGLPRLLGGARPRGRRPLRPGRPVPGLAGGPEHLCVRHCDGLVLLGRRPRRGAPRASSPLCPRTCARAWTCSAPAGSGGLPSSGTRTSSSASST